MRAVYYRTPGGSLPVRDLVATLPPAARAAIDLQIDRLNMLSTSDPPLPFPHSSQIDGELRELRCHFGRELYRVLYHRSRNLFVLLHVFRKTTGRVPEEDIALAWRRWQDFQESMQRRPRVPPRRGGPGAP